MAGVGSIRLDRVDERRRRRIAPSSPLDLGGRRSGSRPRRRFAPEALRSTSFRFKRAESPWPRRSRSRKELGSCSCGLRGPDPDLPSGLRKRGAQVEEVTPYETVEGPGESRGQLRRALREPGLGAVIFASGSAVHGFVKLGGATKLPAITIGPRTSAVASQAGFTVVAEAAAPYVQQLADAVEWAIPIEVTKDA